MIRGTSRDASHDRIATGTTPERGARATLRLPELLRLLQLLLIAIVTVVCAGVTSPTSAVTSVAIRHLHGTASDGANAGRAIAPQPSRQWRDGAPRPADDLDAVEADLDDDDIDDGDTLTDVAAGATLRGVGLLRTSGRVARAEAQSDTSRFALRSGLPRGPPAV